MESKIVILDEIKRSMNDDLYEIYCNENIFNYCGIIPKKNRKTVENMIGHFCRDFEKNKRIKWGIFHKDNLKKMIGIIEIMDINQKVDSLTIGYYLNENYWNRGISTKAVNLLLKYLFEEIHVNRIQAEVMVNNKYSKKVLSRNGFTHEGTLREANIWSGKGLVNLEIYSILKSEYGK